jgi:hypothetical protein
MLQRQDWPYRKFQYHVLRTGYHPRAGFVSKKDAEEFALIHSLKYPKDTIHVVDNTVRSPEIVVSFKNGRTYGPIPSVIITPPPPRQPERTFADLYNEGEIANG